MAFQKPFLLVFFLCSKGLFFFEVAALLSVLVTLYYNIPHAIRYLPFYKMGFGLGLEADPQNPPFWVFFLIDPLHLRHLLAVLVTWLKVRVRLLFAFVFYPVPSRVHRSSSFSPCFKATWNFCPFPPFSL